MKTRFINILMVLVLLTGIIVLGGGVVNAEDAKMVIAIPNEPGTLDLHKDTPRQTKKIQHFINDPLITQDPDTLEYIPGLAKDWEVSEDGKVWTFYLREDVKFHNGEKMTAHDFDYTFKRILDPNTNAQAALQDVGSLEEVVLIDDYTFELHFAEPYASFYHWLAHGWLMPLNKTAVEKYGEDYGQNPVGTGPFKFKEWVSGQRITLVRNEDYDWGPEFYENQSAPYIKEIEFRVIQDLQTTYSGLQSGELDAADIVADKDVSSLRESPDFNLFKAYVPGVGLYGAFNQDSELFKDVAVRKAFNYAINKEVIVEAVKRGNALIAHSVLPHFFIGYDEEAEEYGYSYDIEKAKRTLEEAGWVLNEDGIREKDGIELSGNYLVRNRNDYILAAQMIQQMVKEIGIELRIETLEFGALQERLFAGEHDFTMMGYGTGESDAMMLFMHSSSIGQWNLARLDDPETDRLLEAAREEMDTKKRAELYKQFQKRVIKDLAVWLPLYTDIQYTPVSSRFKNVMIHPNAWLLLNDAQIKE